ncbi:hypothetical protein OUZ56_021709 [Daphnia magna]|uniref:Reverse transcriptase RNase H-like domain-containing protein n=1 Tax=Daphnia magna TaxID=35525 RepID=A0ABR0AUG6_9CRUS|nr:hypothetical protein OUZ56_021709 [Daphnia magna]
MKYSTTEKEALAVIEAMKHFSHYLLEKPFEIISDHRPLKWLKNQRDTLYRRGLPSKDSKRSEINHQLVLPYSLCHLVLKELHDAPMGGHSAFYKTYLKLILLPLFVNTVALLHPYELAKAPFQLTTASNHAINGETERFNRTLTIMLRKELKDGEHADWEDFLDDVLFAYRSSVHSSTLETPYYLVHGNFTDR